MATERNRGELTPFTLLKPFTPTSIFSRFPTAFFEDIQFPEFETTTSGLTLSEDKKNVYVEASVPGLAKEDIEVSYEPGGVLRVKGERKEEEQDKEKRYYRRASRSYSYVITLPQQVDENKEPEANLENGVLRLTFTKAQQSQSKKIKIKGK